MGELCYNPSKPFQAITFQEKIANMSNVQAGLLNLELAWKRVKLDIPYHVFIKNPFEVQLLEGNLAGYLDELSGRIRNDLYHPKPAYICDVPKGNGLIRPGSILSVEDRIVY